ncbi:MAG: hypothetical protein SOY46_01385 [Butyrivibrio crossotus]|nr:hypothetical protein [Butyrivibrio crossotus]
MDKVEYGIKLEQIEKLKSEKQYNEAADIADTIEWRKVKKWSELMTAEEVYEKAERIKEARNICIYAYNRNLGGRSLVFKMTELSIRLEDYEEAEDLYNEFVEMAPTDMNRYVLLYELDKAKNVPPEELIKVLEEYRDNEQDENFGYELASLYAEVGRIEECIKECDDLILWFGDGEYVYKALKLKKKYASLTPAQQEKLNIMDKFDKAGLVYEAGFSGNYDEYEMKSARESMKEISHDETNDDDISVPLARPDIYDTQTLQNDLANSLKEIFQNDDKNDDGNDVLSPVKEQKTEETVPEESADEETVDEETADKVSQPAQEDEEEQTEETPEYDTIIDDDMAATAEPVNVEVIELQMSGDDELVDEPTREIIINTHHWNKIKSEMREDGPMIPEHDAQPEYKEEQIPEAAEEQEMVESVEKQETIPEETDIRETVPEDYKPEDREDRIPVQMELNLEEPPIEGQVDLLYYLEHMNDPVEEPAATIDDLLKTTIENRHTDNTIELDEAINSITRAAISEAEQEINGYADESYDVTDEEEYSSEDSTDELDDNTRKYIKKYLFMNGMEDSILHFINGKRHEIPDGTSRHGNIIIIGKKDTDKTGFAINLFKSLHANDEQRELKIAKTRAEVLNARGVAASADKIKGTTLIVENAEKLNRDVVEELNQFMETDTASMLVIFTGEEFALKRLFYNCESLRDKFDYKLELKHYSVNELVDVATEYARVKGYAIDERALSGLYISIDELNGDDEGTEIEKVKKIVDSAIIKCGKSSRNFFGKKRNGLISLKEKHFLK